eukprot:SAG25_NODE_13583_length_265_cov_0.933735_1_plen_82_part_01
MVIRRLKSVASSLGAVTAAEPAGLQQQGQGAPSVLAAELGSIIQLGSEARQAYARSGYAVLPRLLSAATVATLLQALESVTA